MSFDLPRSLSDVQKIRVGEWGSSMGASITIKAAELPQYIARSVVGHGELKEAAVVQPGGDIVYAKFGEGFGRSEATFKPDQPVQIRADD